ncbi:hypothetical protein PFICI_14573 [Pestalotiopsis fici W106-1]|uniref:DUF7907 domain-containing protein n=1 Tax=Pestalotiopsis fici (strain W106-1 / CGMCC3.15140) TaxID=1229662 RepID=W3WKD3_PESFW|nr:uncharacterized protein PFICI_14573 [Pestalotiopsis fici W106-1]ETS73627.1 hypothetical protein PFICI_14573 [Pestalotiopsis fici W106-1]
MLNLLILLVLLGVASASPRLVRRVVVARNHPPTQSSTGFRLIANVTDPSQDFDPPVHGWVLDAIHIGAGLNDAVLFADGDDVGRVYYVNGTADEIAGGQADTLTDGGTPLFPYGVYVADRNTTDADGLHDVSVNAGSGQVGVQLEVSSSSSTSSSLLYPVLRGPGAAAGTYVACNQYVSYYGENYTTIRWVYDEVDSSATAVVTNSSSNSSNNSSSVSSSNATLAAAPAVAGVRTIPNGCVALTLLPECNVLDELPNGSLASHEFAANSTCYANVSAIDWTLYGP